MSPPVFSSILARAAAIPRLTIASSQSGRTSNATSNLSTADSYLPCMIRQLPRLYSASGEPIRATIARLSHTRGRETRRLLFEADPDTFVLPMRTCRDRRAVVLVDQA